MSLQWPEEQAWPGEACILNTVAGKPHVLNGRCSATRPLPLGSLPASMAAGRGLDRHTDQRLIKVTSGFF